MLADEYYGLAAFEELWEGWTYESRGDQYKWQQELIGVLVRNWEQDVHQCREWMQQHCATRFTETPMTDLIGFLDDEDTLNSESLESAPITGVDDKKILSLLSELAAGEPLPPARFVDRWDEIHGGRG